MSKRSDLVYFGTLLDAARDARNHAQDITKEEYDASRTIQLALTYLVQSVGEAASRVPMPLRVEHPEIDWARMIGMRHRIVHDYRNIDTERVGSVLHEELPLIEQLLAFTPSDPPSP
ncbi:MAG TPA: HepT-like ribonuclease domain-containing protein [Thermoanaerobaculia bacterium]|nr:HepT-like ribonuclease domain-containing protein [Thermoanaerobaculia bacterium]